MAFKTKSTAERIPHIYEGATIFWRPILYDRQREMEQVCTERGEVNWAKVRSLAAKEAVVGWDDQVHDADDQPLVVPTGTEAECREKIATIVSTFPNELIVQLGVLAFADNPEVTKKNWPLLFGANSSLPIDAPATSLPVPTADSSMERTASDRPVTDATP